MNPFLRLLLKSLGLGILVSISFFVPKEYMPVCVFVGFAYGFFIL